MWNGGEFYGTPTASSLHLLARYFATYPSDADKVILSIKGVAVPGVMKIDGSAANVRRSVDECLRILDGKKKIDIFEPGRVDPDVPLEETLNALGECVKEGKIGGIGLSEVDGETVRRAAKIQPIVAVEVELSLHTPEILENGTAAACAELGIPIVAYSPLGRGLLTTQITKKGDIDAGDIRHRLPRFGEGAIETNARMGDELRTFADKKGVTPAQMALAWVRSWSRKGGYGVIVPIPGSTTPERAEENGKNVVLDEKEVEELEAMRKKYTIAGSRY